MTDREQLERAITVLENQRTVLGDAVVDAALVSLREQFSASEEAHRRLASPVSVLHDGLACSDTSYRSRRAFAYLEPV